MIGAIICGILIMVFVAGCGLLALAAVIIGRQPDPLFCVDPEKPGLAIDERGQLVSTGIPEGGEIR